MAATVTSYPLAFAHGLLYCIAMREEPDNFLTIRNPLQWLEFTWLCLTNTTFRATRNKRKAYFDYRMVKRYQRWRF